MCGIAGFLGDSPAGGDLSAIVKAMSCQLAHRGPDYEGVWMDEAAGVALGHRRLSIVDLSATGRQPMLSASGRYVTVLNGEIYNYRDIRAELASFGVTFRGTSDTEVALAAFEKWGIEAAVQRLVGMFAFAVWDRSSRALHLIRDRVGEKPLYYAWMGGTLLFGSEIKSLRAHPSWRGAVEPAALARYFTFGYVPAPTAIYKDVRKVPPGTIITLRQGGAQTETTYWSPSSAAQASKADLHPGNDDEVARQLEVVLARAVEQQMVADVPLGAFLSGGIDSSTLVALMQAASSAPVRTFTIGFDDARYDEAPHAKAIAAHLRTDHTEMYVTDADARDVIPLLPRMYDEPFADSSQIPTYLVSRIARQQVTVALSGDGADELFGGYGRYHSAARIWPLMSMVPRAIRTVAGRHVARSGPRFLAWRAARRGANSSGRDQWPRLARLGGLMSAASIEDMYQSVIARPRGSDIVAAIPAGSMDVLRSVPQNHDAVEAMMWLDFTNYLPDDILVKVDRAAMSVGLETRAPFLDHRVVEFVWRLRREQKIHRGVGKRVLKKVLQRHVPLTLFERPKMGFSVPLAAWLRGPLHPWAEELLEERRLREDGYLDAAVVRRTWSEHVSGTADWGDTLWDVLMFQAWLDAQGQAEVPYSGLVAST